MRNVPACCVVWVFLLVAIGSAADPQPVRVGTVRQLFLDDRVVASSQGHFDVGRFRGKTIRLVFRLKNSQIYGFQFQATKS